MVIKMKNGIYDIVFNKENGLVESLTLKNDSDKMNWVNEDGKWGYIHQINYDGIYGDYKSRQKEMRLLSFNEDDNAAEAVYSNDALQTTVKSYFDINGNFAQRFTFKNLLYADLFMCEHNCSIEIPFDDRYTYADDCLSNRCNTHIWCGGSTTYINALKMGMSDNNLGLVVTKGSFDSYSILDSRSNIRGRFLLNPEHFELMRNEEYVIEWVIFPHKGSEDFYKKALNYSSFIDVRAEHYTLFLGENIVFSAAVGENIDSVRVYTDSGDIEYKKDERSVEVDFKPSNTGEYRIFIEINGKRTYADFIVKENFETIVKNRVKFLVDNQQYHKKGSPLDGAFLIYDNKKKHMIFEDNQGDHNATQERLGMSLLLAKYLQTHENSKYYDALIKSVNFIKREIYEEERGCVYCTIGWREKKENRMRLYNAPWVTMLFTEVYYLTKDKSYLDNIIKIFKLYYTLGGTKFYPNGISVYRTAMAFKDAEMDKEYSEILKLFKVHVDNMVKNKTSYPKHEVNYEQTIVSPAATFISEFAVLSGDERYVKEAKNHIEILERFNGHQPSYHLNEIPIRYWDDYWFGKFMLRGDTFPHYWACLTARSFNDYYKASGDKTYLERAKECMRNCMCLISDDGKGSAAYMYPYRLNDEYGEKYDDWANDQDFALYFALETGLLQ